MALIFIDHISFFPLLNSQGFPTVRQIPEPATMRRWGNDQKRAWLSNEIDEFLNVFVFKHHQLDEFVAAVEELDTQQRNGFPCRECGEIFRTHPLRVEYVCYLSFHFIKKNTIFFFFIANLKCFVVVNVVNCGKHHACTLYYKLKTAVNK